MNVIWLLNLFPLNTVVVSFQKTANAQFTITVKDVKTDKKLAEGWGASEEQAVESILRYLCDDLIMGKEMFEDG